VQGSVVQVLRKGKKGASQGGFVLGAVRRVVFMGVVSRVDGVSECRDLEGM
jgi:hypothetical protein